MNGLVLQSGSLSAEGVIFVAALFIFACGCAGVVMRRNPISLLMAVELMLNAAIMTFVLGSRVWGQVHGQAAALLVLVFGAAEAVVGLALALAVFRQADKADVDDPKELRG